MNTTSFLCVLFSHPQDRQSGDYLHRVAWPGKALGRSVAVHAIQSSHPHHLEKLVEADVLVINMVADARLLPLIRKRREERKVTVFEISDDFRSFPSHLPAHAFYSSREVQDTIATLASESDAIQFSSRFLREKYGHLNAMHTTFPNQLPAIPTLKPAPGRKAVLGWAGSVGHFEDARWLAGTLSRWTLAGKIAIRLMATDEIASLFRSSGLDVSVTTPGDMRAYLNFLGKIDIGLAIAHGDDFASGRSDGKFIEYASRGVVAVCSDGAPYSDSVRHGETGFLFRDEEELLEILTRLVRDGGLRNRIRRQAHQYLRTSRTHAAAAQERLDFYTRLLASGKHDRASARVTASPGYRELIDDIEPAFTQAMLMHREGKAAEAIAIYTRLAEKAPAFHLLWERMGQACTLLGATAQAESCRQRARFLLEEDYARCGLAMSSHAT